MNSTREEKLSRSALVDFLWQSENLTDGVYVASTDASWDMIFTRTRAGQPKVLLCGPYYKTAQVPFCSGEKHIGICFKPWAVFTGIPMTTLLNSGEFLHTPSEDTFVMQGITWNFRPTRHSPIFPRA